MTSQATRIRALFHQALEITTAAARQAYLDQACADVPDLRPRVEALLKAYDDAGSFLEAPAQPLTLAAEPEPSDDAGLLLAERYKLLERIGEGGMGSVWMAEQQAPVRRLVAVKLIKPGMDSKAVLARFEAERQALALMDHPNIARVLDAGAAADGRPFFVMELVKGVPITKFCDENKLTSRQRLELFIPVCQAIQHAHQKGIIHRDIKPTNVLVALYDGQPVPKVIDFGVAKAAGQPLTEKTLVTGFGAIIGTPEYMSPEQATFNQLDIDTRSDVYALGVLLYELLTGTTPVDKEQLEKAAVLEVLRIVREEEPPRPSVKLSTTEARGSIAARRGTEPDKLAKLLRGELDWIVMKSLEKDRNRRYETAAGLARDVDRYLKDELVEARPPSAGYRLRKFVRKHRGPVLAASLMLVLLLAGVAGTTLGMVRAWHAEAEALEARTVAEGNKAIADALKDEALLALDDAEHQRQQALDNERKAKAAGAEAKAVLSFLQDKVLAAQRPKGVDGGLGKGATLEQAIEAAEPAIGATFKDQPLVEASIRYSLGMTYVLLDQTKKALGHLDRAWTLRKAHLGGAHPLTLKVLDELAMQSWNIEPAERTERLFKEAVAGWRAQNSTKNWEELSEAMFTLGIFYHFEERPREAIPVYEELAVLARKHGGSDDAIGHLALYRLGDLYASCKRYPDAVRARQEYLAHRQPPKAGAQPKVSPLETLDPFDKALLQKMGPIFERMEMMFVPTEESWMLDLQEHGEFLLKVEHPREAETALRECLALRDKKQEHWLRFETMNLLGAALAAQQKHAAAEPLLKSGYEGMQARRAKIAEHSRYRVGAAGNRLAKHYEATGKAELAATLRQELEALRKQPKAPSK